MVLSSILSYAVARDNESKGKSRGERIVDIAFFLSKEKFWLY